MASSSILLSIASVFGVLGLVLAAIALSTDNWFEVKVERRRIIEAFNREQDLNLKLKDAFMRNPIYFTRTYGLFLVCFPDTVPNDVGSFSKFGQTCINNDEYFPPESVQAQYTSGQTNRLYTIRGMAFVYCLGMLLLAISGFVGLFGCYRRSPRIITATAVSFLICALLLAAGTGLWQYTNFSDWRYRDYAPYFISWDTVLKGATSYNYGWSFVAAWTAVGCVIVASIFLFFAPRCIEREEEKALMKKQGAYMIPNYYDKGQTMVPYGYNTYGASGYGGGYPYYNTYNNGGYYGYMTYGR